MLESSFDIIQLFGANYTTIEEKVEWLGICCQAALLVDVMNCPELKRLYWREALRDVCITCDCVALHTLKIHQCLFWVIFHCHVSLCLRYQTVELGSPKTIKKKRRDWPRKNNIGCKVHGTVNWMSSWRHFYKIFKNSNWKILSGYSR